MITHYSMYNSLQNINDEDKNFVQLSLHLFLIFKDMPIIMVQSVHNHIQWLQNFQLWQVILELQNFRGRTCKISEKLVSYRSTAYVPGQHVQYLALRQWN